jgi:hypothetical protein
MSFNFEAGSEKPEGRRELDRSRAAVLGAAVLAFVSAGEVAHAGPPTTTPEHIMQNEIDTGGFTEGKREALEGDLKVIMDTIGVASFDFYGKQMSSHDITEEMKKYGDPESLNAVLAPAFVISDWLLKHNRSDPQFVEKLKIIEEHSYNFPSQQAEALRELVELTIQEVEEQ